LPRRALASSIEASPRRLLYSAMLWQKGKPTVSLFEKTFPSKVRLQAGKARLRRFVWLPKEIILYLCASPRYSFFPQLFLLVALPLQSMTLMCLVRGIGSQRIRVKQQPSTDAHLHIFRFNATPRPFNRLKGNDFAQLTMTKLWGL